MSAAAGATRGLLRRLRKAALGTLAAVLLLALVEGLLSFAVVVRSIATKTPPFFGPSRQLMTRFDAELGWTTTPGYRDPDAYGRGLGVAIGARGFRFDRAVADAVAPGRVRMVVAGDSFAFGTGVADEATWAAGLERLEPRLETVVCAVGGYGCDQAWLRYRRDCASFEHQLLLFGFITEDLRRMVVPPEWGAAKPRLELDGAELRVAGIPLEPVAPQLRFLRQAGTFARELRLAQALERAGVGAPEPAQAAREQELEPLALALLAEVVRLARERGAHPVIVHLPVEDERDGGSIDALAPRLAAQVRAGGGDWIDLLAEFRALPADEHAALFLRPPASGAGHYDAHGCDFVARALHAKLRALPEVARRLDGGR